MPILSRAVFIAALGLGPSVGGAQRVAYRDAGPREAGALEARARLTIENVALAVALNELAQRSGVPLAFSVNHLPHRSRLVTCLCDDLTVGQALERLIDRSEVAYREINGQIVLYPTDRSAERIRPGTPVTPVELPASVLALATLAGPGMTTVEPQGASIAGSVVGARGQPLAGARVRLSAGPGGAETRTASTDDAGRFRFESVSGAQARISVAAIGYAPLSVSVRVGDENLRLMLTESAVNLDELVVTGTPGGTEKRALGNSISQIKVTDVVELAPISNVSQLINGRAAGVVVQPGSGAVGSGPRIRIRGASSLSLFTNEPLLYVDGVRVDNRAGLGPRSQSFNLSAVGGGVVSRLGDFNPEDIESIEIIKGPAAAALYGTEASAGVIQIITRKGKVGARPEIGLTVRQGANWFMNAIERWPTLYGRTPGTGELIVWNALQAEQDRGTPVFRTGHVQNYGMRVGGGTDRLRYYVGGDLDSEGGIEPTNSLLRLSGRSNLDVKFGEKADLGVNLGLVSSDLKLPGEVFSGPWYSMDFGHPLELGTPRRGFHLAPPEAWRDAMENKSETNRFTAGLQLVHRPKTWLKQRLALGIDLVNDDSYTLFRNIGSDPYLKQFTPPFGSPLGTKWARRERGVTNTVDYAITATASIAKPLTSSTSAGLQFYRNYLSFQTAEGRDFPDFSIESISAAATTFSSDGFVENTTVGMYLQQQLGWRNRLFVTGALRADDNSAFGENFNLVYYPKASLSWVMSEEPFWHVSFVDVLKFRAAYGQSGQQPQAFAAIRTYLPIPGPTGAPGLISGASGNADLGPERSKEIELGLEAGLLQGRLGLDLTYYSKTTDDAILAIPNIPSEGFGVDATIERAGTRFENLGTIRNRGVEALVHGRVLEGRSVTWELGLNLSRNWNEVVHLVNGQDQIVALGGLIRHSEGHPSFSIYTRRVLSAEVGSDGIARNIMCDGGPANNGQPMPCAQAPALFAGQALPKVEGSGSTAVTLFGKLRVQALVDFKTGHKLFDNSAYIRCFFGTCKERVLPGEFDPLHIGAIQGTLRDWAVADAGFAKLREVSATYTLPAAWIKPFGVSRGTVTVAGRNLHTWTSWPDVDPEAYQEWAGVANLFSPRNTTPQLAQFVTTVNLTF